MATQFTYSILQYKHSIAYGECLNVGILFLFEEEKVVRFIAGNTQRVKCVYPNFDQGIFNLISKGIRANIDKHHPFRNDLLSLIKPFNLVDFLSSLLLPDATSLQFSEPSVSVNPFKSVDVAIEEFSRTLLPDTQVKKEEELRHNENYILRRYIDNVANKNINIDHRMTKNKVISTKSVELTFDLAWKNGTTHLVKPISFDLKEGKDIQNKSVQFFGYLDLLNEYATLNNYSFDLLIGKPQDEALSRYYEKALDVLSQANAPKEIITEDRLQEYSEETAVELHKRDLE